MRIMGVAQGAVTHSPRITSLAICVSRIQRIVSIATEGNYAKGVQSTDSHKRGHACCLRTDQTRGGPFEGSTTIPL